MSDTPGINYTTIPRKDGKNCGNCVEGDEGWCCYAKDHIGEKNGFFGKTHSDKFKEQQRILLTGHVESDETKNKKRVANLKRYEDPKEHERTSASNRKRFEDPEQRDVQRVNQLRVFEEHPERKELSVQTLKNIVKTPEHKKKIGLSLRGENNGCWKGGVTPLRIQVRCCTKMYVWIQQVLKRDNYRDWFCGLKGTTTDPVEAHHIVKFATIMSKYKIKTLEDAESCDELWDINNGITLLRSSHKAYHDMWGR